MKHVDVLRPEARPLPYDHLDEQQQIAFTRVVGLLTAATTSAAQASSTSTQERGSLLARGMPRLMPGPYLESRRSSRNILVSGERGTGKTTLMLSLTSMLAPAVEETAPVDETIPPEVVNQIRELRRRLVWLETLDMEPIASEANLLGAVLARIEDAVGARLPSMDKPTETASLLHPGVGFHDVSRELGRLQTSVVLTFGGNLFRRAGSLDPDTFAVESRRAERERLGLDRRFAAVLAGLSSALAASTVELTAPVFVLPVDDVDLNVGDCVPLLRLLRAASSPHLIVVLAADVGLLSTILRLWYQAELARISAPVELSHDDTRTAVDLAANALRKHLPPAQRVVLGFVEPRRALALRPLGPGTPSLGQVLGQADLPPDEAALQVHTGFGLLLENEARTPRTTRPTWPAAPQADPGELAARLNHFSWPKVLRQPLRQLVDLYLDCTLRADQPQPSAPLGHEVTASPLVRLALTRAQAGRQSPHKEPSGLQVSGWFGDYAPAPADEAPAVQDRPWHGWRVTAAHGLLGMAEAESLIGCAELLGDRWAETRYGPSRPVASMPAVRVTRWPGNAGDARLIDWPWVSHSTFWGYERALAWLAEADETWAGKPDAAFGSWVAVMTAQLFDAPDQHQPFDRPTRPFDKDWTGLANRLAALDESDKTPLASAWLDAVGLLCTPEMGMRTLADIPPLLPSRAERVRDLRTERASNLPPSLREVALSWPPAPEPTNQEQAPKAASAEDEEDEEDSVPPDGGDRTPQEPDATSGGEARTSTPRPQSSRTRRPEQT